MPYYTYILQSEKTGRLYIGQTRDVSKRITEHNAGLSRSTRGYIPWKLLHYEELNNRHEAMKLEHKLKKWKSKIRVLEWIDRQLGESVENQLVERRPDETSG